MDAEEERKTMRLSCNLIINNGPGMESTFFTAGESIPDELVPAHALEYRISEREGAKLYREILEWRAIVAERREKNRASRSGERIRS
jgi:hypothetical protein